MILTAGGKEVQFWVHLENSDRPGLETTMAPRGPAMETATASTSGRPPLPHQSHQSHATLLRAASSFKEKSPAIYRSLSADGTRIYDSIKCPPEDKSSLESSPSPSFSSSPSPSGRIQYPSLQEPTSSKQFSFHDSLPSSSSTRADRSNLGIPPAPPPSPSLTSRGLRPLVFSSTAPKKTPKCGRNLLYKESIDIWDRVFFQGVNTDVTIYTNDGYELDAHSMVLMCSSPVLKCMLKEEFRRSTHAYVNIRGVPFQAVRCFVRFLYSSRCEEEDMEMFAIHLLVLAHAYMIPALKRLCTDTLEHRLLNSDNVVDVLQIARLCDASWLHLLCLRRIVTDFKTIARSEAWRIMKESDPTLEQELVEAVVEAETKRRDQVRKQGEDKVYAQLHDAMEALVHICRDGCRSIGPHDKALDGQQKACSYPACKGLESLVRHFAACKLKVSGGCVHCKCMWQLLELHSRMCTLQDASCKVPLCRYYTTQLLLSQTTLLMTTLDYYGQRILGFKMSILIDHIVERII